MKTRAYLDFLLSPKANIATSRVRSVFDIDLTELQQRGIKTILLDIDDTIAGHRSPVPPDAAAWVASLAPRFAVGIVSNSGPRRRQEVPASLGGIAINTGPDKPAASAFEDVLQTLGAKAAEAAMIGDRRSMDLYGAMRAGLPVRILVEPFSAVRSGWPAPGWYRLVRWLENGRRRI